MALGSNPIVSTQRNRFPLPINPEASSVIWEIDRADLLPKFTHDIDLAGCKSIDFRHPFAVWQSSLEFVGTFNALECTIDMEGRKRGPIGYMEGNPAIILPLRTTSKAPPDSFESPSDVQVHKFVDTFNALECTIDMKGRKRVPIGYTEGNPAIILPLRRASKTLLICRCIRRE